MPFPHGAELRRARPKPDASSAVSGSPKMIPEDWPPLRRTIPRPRVRERGIHRAAKRPNNLKLEINIVSTPHHSYDRPMLAAAAPGAVQVTDCQSHPRRYRAQGAPHQLRLPLTRVGGLANTDTVYGFAKTLTDLRRPYSLRRGDNDLVVFCFASRKMRKPSPSASVESDYRRRDGDSSWKEKAPIVTQDWARGTIGAKSQSTS